MRSYQHHIGDFNHATRHLTRIERSIYRDLIELYYDTEQQLPDDLSWICRKIVANECSTDVERLLNEFFTKTPDGWYHERCEHEIERYRSVNSQKALAGKASAAKRAEKLQQALNGRSATVHNQEPITNNQEPVKKKPLSAGADRMGDVTHVFEHWQWRMNHKGAKLDDKRKKLITKALKLGYAAVDLIAAIDGCAKSPFHMGQNDRNTVYDGLDLILRDASKIDHFIKINNQPQQAGGTHAHTGNATGRPAKPAEVVANYLFGDSGGSAGSSRSGGKGGFQEADVIEGTSVHVDVSDDRDPA